MKDLQDQVKSMIRKAAEAADPQDAMKYSQAGLNAAHAARLLFDMGREGANAG